MISTEIFLLAQFYYLLSLLLPNMFCPSAMEKRINYCDGLNNNERKNLNKFILKQVSKQNYTKLIYLHIFLRLFSKSELFEPKYLHFQIPKYITKRMDGCLN